MSNVLPKASSFLVLALLAAACATETTDTDYESTEDALGRQSGIDVADRADRAGPVGPTTPPPPATPRKSPRVLSRSAQGSAITVGLDRAVATDEIADVQVLVVRPSGSGFAKTNIASGVTFSADRKTMTIATNQALRAGEIYFPRADWRPCAGTTAGAKCRVRPANFGEVIARSRRTLPWGDVVVQPVGVLFAAAPGLAAPAETAIDIPEVTPPSQGTFRVKSVSPENEATGVERRTEKVIVTFEGGTIDCAKTGRGKEAFHLHSVSPDVYDQQSMYEDPAAPQPNIGGYRGNIRCEADTNRLIFTTPGVLLGDSWFQIDLNVWSQEGNFMGGKVLEFKTKRPGLQILATRVENHYGGDNTCDNDWFGTNYCDVYVTSAIATAGGGQPSRIPEQGDFSGMTYFPSDPNGGKRDLQPARVIYANANPVDEVVDVQMWSLDADSDSAWKKVFETAGKIAGAMASALTPIKPEAGAIAEGASAGFLGLAEVIPTNEDDYLGSGRFIFTQSTQRWGTQAVYPIPLELSKNAPNRGPVKVFLRTEELPLSWSLPGPIL